MSSNGKPWTVFQRRYNGSVDFYRDWATYKKGFGSKFGEYWIGNDVLHELTSRSPHELRIEITKFGGQTEIAEYTPFHVGDELNGYIVTLSGFNTSSGTTDCLTSGNQPINGMKFSTHDVDNDIGDNVNCAEQFKGGWWYNNCHWANLNGLYLAVSHDSYADSINWASAHESLKRVIMMIRKVYS